MGKKHFTEEQIAFALRQHAEHYETASACGDNYGGFQMSLDRDFRLEAFPCDSRRGTTPSTGDSLATGTTALTSSLPVTVC
ncbi:MAG TPA: hypothetical protein VGN12_05600 [Pirellulales bacterium]|jgi:hypothetical protein